MFINKFPSKTMLHSCSAQVMEQPCNKREWVMFRICRHVQETNNRRKGIKSTVYHKILFGFEKSVRRYMSDVHALLSEFA